MKIFWELQFLMENIRFHINTEWITHFLFHHITLPFSSSCTSPHLFLSSVPNSPNISLFSPGCWRKWFVCRQCLAGTAFCTGETGEQHIKSSTRVTLSVRMDLVVRWGMNRRIAECIDGRCWRKGVHISFISNHAKTTRDYDTDPYWWRPISTSTTRAGL